MDQILARNPRIVGVGVYIWNVEPSTRLVADLKKVRPELFIVLGGPEVSYEWDEQPIVEMADYVITGEADLLFPELCRRVLSGERPSEKIQIAEPPVLSNVKLPYEEYTPEDIANRVIYVEASRGCPFTCEFCLSALEIPVRQFPLDEFLAAIQSLLDRGTRQFKFVDRTFNLNLKTSRAILEFFLDRYEPGLFLHFEMIPDRLPESLRDIIAQFPPGALQFEVGIQTFDPLVSESHQPQAGCGEAGRKLDLPPRTDRRPCPCGFDRGSAGRRCRHVCQGVQSPGGFGSAGNPSGDAETAKRHAHHPPRCRLANGLQPPSAV